MEDEETGELFIPCRECSHKCFKRHGKYHDKQCFDGSASFFKVLLGDFEEKLCVPPAFASEFINEKDKHMVLQGPEGREWKVELSNINGKLEFRGDGWKKFVHYHSLQMGDFVVFYYTARLYMEVHMFGRSGCAKSTSVVDFEKPNTDSNKKSPPNKMCSLNETPGKTMSIDSVSDEESNHDPQAVVDKQKRKRKSSFRGHSSHNPGHCFSSQKDAPMESAASFKSDKPFCRMVFKSWNVKRHLMFTNSLIQDYMIQLPNQKSEVLLLNGQCKEWKINCVMKHNNPTFSGGWRNFIHDNNVKEGDTCVFEQLNNNENKFIFKVHIFPKGPDKTSSIDLVSDEENNHESEAQTKIQKRKRKSSFLGHSSRNPGHCFSSQKDLPMESADLKQKDPPMESAASFKSDKPFCRMVMKSWNVNRQYYIIFNKGLIRDYPIQLPTKKCEVLLLNGECKAWKVKFIIKDMYPTFSGGWKFFTDDNNVKEGDTCIFEQLNNNENKFMYRVHIFPFDEKGKSHLMKNKFIKRL